MTVFLPQDLNIDLKCLNTRTVNWSGDWEPTKEPAHWEGANFYGPVSLVPCVIQRRRGARKTYWAIDCSMYRPRRWAQLMCAQPAFPIVLPVKLSDTPPDAARVERHE
jgi:hypothetical protein